LPGSEGYNKAAQLRQINFSELGLKPAGDEKYFQYFNVEYNKIESPPYLKLLLMVIQLTAR